MEETNTENSTNELVPDKNEDNVPKVKGDKSESLEAGKLVFSVVITVTLLPCM